MAQTIEEIAEILRTLKLDNDISTEEIQKSLSVLNTKLELIADDVEANKTVRDSLAELKSILDTNTEKYNQFEQAFRYISSAQDASAKTSDIDTLIKKVDDNLTVLQNSFFEKSSENLQNITNSIGNVNSSLEKVNDELSERISLNFDTTRDLIENINQEISRQHAVMQNERQNADEKQAQGFDSLAGDIRALGENLVLQSSNYRELMELKTADIKDYINSSGAALASAQVASENKLSEKLTALENLNHGFEANIIDVNNSLQSIIQNIMSMDPTVQNDIIKKELETIYLATNGILSSLQIFDQKNDELAKTVSQLMTRENFDVAQQRLEDIVDRINDIDAHVSEIGLSLDFDTVSNKLDGLAYVIDNLKNMLQDIGKDDRITGRLDDLDRKFSAIITEDDFNAFRGDLTDFIQKIVDNSNFLNNDLVENKEKIEQILKSLQSLDFMDKLNDIAANVDSISTSNVNAITSSMGELSEKLDNISDDFTKKAGENVDTLTSAISVVSTKLDFVNNYLSQDIPSNLGEIKEMNESIRDFITGISEAYQSEGAALEDRLSAKLFEIQKSFMENLDGYQQKLSDLKQESRHFNQEFVEILDNKTGDIATALEPVKTSLEEIIKYDFSSNLSGLKEQIDQIYANVNTQMQMTLGQNQVLTDSLEKIYNDAVDKINDVNNAISSQVQNNLEVLKSAVEEINNGVKDSFDNNNQLMIEWKSLLVLIDGKITDLSANCTNMLSSVAVDVTNAVNSKIETLLEDLKGYIGVPVNANDLMWSVDNLKTELTNKFTELEEKQSSKEDDSTVRDEILLILNQLGVKVEELGTRYSNEEFNEILGSSRMQLMSGLKDLKNIILIAMKEVAKSSAASMDEMHEKIDTLLQKEADEELHQKINNIDNKTSEIIDKLDNVSSNTGSDIETTQVLISLNSKLDSFSENTDKNTQALGAIYEKVDSLGSTDDQIANSLMNIAEKFSGLRQNTDQLTNDFAGVNETVEAMNIRSDKVASSIDEISERTSGIAQTLDQKSEQIIESVNIVSDKLDAFASVDDKITQSLDIISDKIDNNETNEQITQGMQYLNDKMDSINENDERISRTIDVVLDKIETFSVSDDGINQSLENISDKIDTIGSNSDKVTECIDELTNKITAFGENDERVMETIDTLSQKIEAVGEESERSKDLMNSISDKVEMVGDSSDKLNEKIDVLSEKIDTFAVTDDRIAQAIDTLGEKTEIVSLNAEKNGQTLDDISTKVDNISDNTRSIAGVFEQLRENVSSVGEVVATSVDSVSSKLVDTSQVILNGMDVLSGNALENKQEILDNLGSVATTVEEQKFAIKDSINELGEKLEGNKQEIFEKISDGNQIVADTISEFSNKLLENKQEISEKIKEEGSYVADKVAEVSDKLTSATKLVMNSVNEVSDKVATSNEILSRSIDVITDRVASNVANVDANIESLGEKLDAFAQNDEQMALTMKEISDKVDILKVDTTKEHIATSLDVLNDKADAQREFNGKLTDAIEGLSTKMDTFSLVDEQLLRKSSEISDKADEITAVADQMTGVLNNIAENTGKIDNVSASIDRVAGFTKNIASSLGAVTETIENNDKDVRQSLAEFGQKFDDFAFNDGAIVKTMEVLSDKIDVFKFNTNNEHIVSSLDSLHEKVTDCHTADMKLADTAENISSKADTCIETTDAIKNDLAEVAESVDIISAKIDTFAEADDRIHDTLTDLADKIDVVKLETNNDNIINGLRDVNEKVDDLTTTGDQIENTLQVLQDKVVALSEKDVFDGFDVQGEIKNIKSMISAQRQYLEDTEISDRTIAMDDCLQELQKKIDKISENVSSIDLEENAEDIKNHANEPKRLKGL